MLKRMLDGAGQELSSCGRFKAQLWNEFGGDQLMVLYVLVKGQQEDPVANQRTRK